MAVACGHNHTVVIDENGYLFGFGTSNRGQLGTNASDESDELYEYHEPEKSMLLCPCGRSRLGPGTRAS